MILSNEIKRLRIVANLTMREAAAASGLALTAYSAIENAHRNASPEARQRISLALGMPAEYLAEALYVCGDCGKPLPCECPPNPVFYCRVFR